LSGERLASLHRAMDGAGNARAFHGCGRRLLGIAVSAAGSASGRTVARGTVDAVVRVAPTTIIAHIARMATSQAHHQPRHHYAERNDPSHVRLPFFRVDFCRPGHPVMSSGRESRTRRSTPSADHLPAIGRPSPTGHTSQTSAKSTSRNFLQHGKRRLRGQLDLPLSTGPARSEQPERR
jgi:hypothetical protein